MKWKGPLAGREEEEEEEEEEDEGRKFGTNLSGEDYLVVVVLRWEYGSCWRIHFLLEWSIKYFLRNKGNIYLAWRRESKGGENKPGWSYERDSVEVKNRGGVSVFVVGPVGSFEKTPSVCKHGAESCRTEEMMWAAVLVLLSLCSSAPREEEGGRKRGRKRGREEEREGGRLVGD